MTIRIAVFEDDAATALILKARLELWLKKFDCDFIIELYADAIHYQKLEPGNWPQLIVTDHCMPSGNSQMVVNSIISRAHDYKLLNPIFICFTAAKSSEVRTRLFSHVVPKFDWDMLEERVTLCVEWLIL